MLAIHNISARIPKLCVFFLADMCAMPVQWSTQVDEIAAWVNAKLDGFYETNDPNDCEEKALAEEII